MTKDKELNNWVEDWADGLIPIRSLVESMFLTDTIRRTGATGIGVWHTIVKHKTLPFYGLYTASTKEESTNRWVRELAIIYKHGKADCFHIPNTGYTQIKIHNELGLDGFPERFGYAHYIEWDKEEMKFFTIDDYGNRIY